ncbi:mCG145843, partial [Mus musculus]
TRYPSEESHHPTGLESHEWKPGSSKDPFLESRHPDVTFSADVGVCLSQGFYSCTNIMTKKQVGEERIYLAYTSILLFITKEVRTGTQAGQEAGADAEAMEGSFLLACFP